MLALASCLLAALTVADPPDRPPRRLPAQTWPVVVSGGIQALGWKPTPPSPGGSIGTEARLVARRPYGLHLGLALGGFHQIGLVRAGYLDATLGQRLTARLGLYGDLDVVVGGQLWALGATTYRRGDDGRLRASRSPVLPNARLGLAVALGFDFGKRTRAPIRVFARYQQLLVTPFMPGNGVLAMGIASLTTGIAVEVGTWTQQRARK